MAIINGTFLPDILLGTAGDDTINGFGGLDTLSGGDGHDTIDGGAGDDVLIGGEGNDVLIGGTGAATQLSVYSGGNGNDMMIASDLGVSEDFDGGDGVDTVSFAARDNGVTVFLSVIGIPLLDTVRNTENVIGSAFDDEITGDGGDNEITGGEGDDVIDGSGGNDTAVYSGNRADYVASLGGGAIIITDQRSGTTDGEDTVSGVELFKFADGTYTALQLFAPTLAGLAAGATFSENTVNAAPGFLDSSVSVTILQSIDGGTLEISGLLAEDVVSVQHVGSQAGEIGFSGGNISYGGTIIGTAAGGNGATLTITFNASASSAAVQALIEHLGYQNTSHQPTLMRNLTITLTDGHGGSASGNFVITITAQNDAPSITSDGGGAAAGVSVQENATAVTTVVAADPDLNPTVTYSIVGGADHALFQIDAGTGVLSFIAAPDFEAPGDAGADNSYLVEVQASDGTLIDTQTITVTVTNENENPAITSTTSVSVQENTTAVMTVTAEDPDLNANLVYSIIGGVDQAFFQIDALTGVLSFITAPNYEAPADGGVHNLDAPAGPDNHYIVKVQVSDGVHADSRTITVTVTDASEAPSITSDSGAATATVSVEENTTAVTTVVAEDQDAATTLVYSIVGGADHALFQIDAATGVLSFIAAPDYEAPADSDADNGYVVEVQASDGSLNDVQTITVNVVDAIEPTDDPPSGGATPGDDVFTAPAGKSRIDALGGVDTVKFDFMLTEATFDWIGNTVVITSNHSKTILTGVEVLEFTDGTVNNADGNALVDDLFYFAQYHDVWASKVDPDFHYAEWGWKEEDRNPNAFFDTSLYLGLNPDVAAAGVDPLEHFHQIGWKEGRIPSFKFDPQKYLAENPDVAAAGLDPLEHFLEYGAGEGRQPTAVVPLIASDGFDAAYYLAHYNDVATAGVDPYTHYQQYGWREGRMPNPVFDTAGYLEHNADVAAANVDPLYHYVTWGWLEGRDPSADFDTDAYLAANPDVVSAQVNPMLHYLQYGILEGRSPQGDGLWS